MDKYTFKISSCHANLFVTNVWTLGGYEIILAFMPSLIVVAFLL